jgi:peptidoglycan hydrolase-like protein with peptidoglycan-binding domain
MKQNLRIFDQALGGKKDIQTLQEVLTELSLYDGEITQDYNSIEASILEYQVENAIVSGVDDLGAGVFGPKTRKSLKEVYQAYIEAEIEKQELTALLEEFTQESELQAQEKLSEIGESSYGEISPRVRELQVTLSELGYFEYKDTAIFGVKTKNSIIALQIDTGLLKTASDI